MRHRSEGRQRQRPFSAACERNRAPILAVLQRHFPAAGRVLEIGSGTGQHAVYFGARLPGLIWLTSDREVNHPGIRAWIEAAALDNVLPPVRLDVTDPDWPVDAVDGVFSANTAHIMHWPELQAMIAGAGRVLLAGGVFCLYGPFHYGGEHSSESNAAFDQHLRAEDPGMGIRDAKEVERLAMDAGLSLIEDVAMPANNRTLVFRMEQGS